jgi:hypothetical protein
MGTGIEVLAVGNYLMRKQDQAPGLDRRYHSSFALD